MLRFISRKSALVFGFLSCVSFIALSGGTGAQQTPTLPKVISLGSFISETNFDSKLRAEQACSSSFYGWCQDSAVAAIEQELKQQRALALSEILQPTLEPLVLSSFSKPVPQGLKENIFSKSAFDLKIPFLKAFASTLRSEEEKAKPKFSFSNSYAFLGE